MGRGGKKRGPSVAFSKLPGRKSAFPEAGVLLGLLPDRRAFWDHLREREIFVNDLNINDPVFLKYYAAVESELEKEALLLGRESFLPEREMRYAFFEDFLQQMTFGEDLSASAWLFRSPLSAEVDRYYSIAITAAPNTKEVAEWILENFVSITSSWQEAKNLASAPFEYTLLDSFEYKLSSSIKEDTSQRLAEIDRSLVHTFGVPENYFYNIDYAPVGVTYFMIKKNLRALLKEKTKISLEKFSDKVLNDALSHQLATVVFGSDQSIMENDIKERFRGKKMDDLIYNLEHIFKDESMEEEFSLLVQKDLSVLDEDAIYNIVFSTARRLSTLHRIDPEEILLSEIFMQNIKSALFRSYGGGLNRPRR